MSSISDKAKGLGEAEGGTIGQWQALISEWAEHTFANHTAREITLHVVREATELALACGLSEVDIAESVHKSVDKHPDMPTDLPTIMEQTADVVILCLALAGHLGLQLDPCLTSKMAINMLREWGEPDEQGVGEHTVGGGSIY